MTRNRPIYVEHKDNIFVRFWRFFFPKEGWGKAFQNGLTDGKEIGKQRAKAHYAKKVAKK